MIEQRLRSCIVLLAALSAMVGHPAAVRADPIDGGRIQVLDGDTIRLDGAKPDVRLVGSTHRERRAPVAQQSATPVSLRTAAFASLSKRASAMS